MPAQVWGGTCIAALHCASRAWQRPRSGLGLAMTLAGMAGAGLGGGLCATLSSQIQIWANFSHPLLSSGRLRRPGVRALTRERAP